MMDSGSGDIFVDTCKKKTQIQSIISMEICVYMYVYVCTVGMYRPVFLPCFNYSHKTQELLLKRSFIFLNLAILYERAEDRKLNLELLTSAKSSISTSIQNKPNKNSPTEVHTKCNLTSAPFGMNSDTKLIIHL